MEEARILPFLAACQLLVLCSLLTQLEQASKSRAVAPLKMKAAARRGTSTMASTATLGLAANARRVAHTAKRYVTAPSCMAASTASSYPTTKSCQLRARRSSNAKLASWHRGLCWLAIWIFGYSATYHPLHAPAQMCVCHVLK